MKVKKCQRFLNLMIPLTCLQMMGRVYRVLCVGIGMTIKEGLINCHFDRREKSSLVWLRAYQARQISP